MNEEVAIKICEQMTSDVHDLCICCRKNEKDRTCIGCRELAIETILKENARLKGERKQIKEYIEKCNFDNAEILYDFGSEYCYIDDFKEHIFEILKEN